MNYIEKKPIKSLSSQRSIIQIITDNFCALAQTYEGRDKMVKFFQYLAMYLSWHFNRKRFKSDPKYAKESELYKSISQQLYDSRSLFRLFKSLLEIKRI
jgi:hypothetical protein